MWSLELATYAAGTGLDRAFKDYHSHVLRIALVHLGKRVFISARDPREPPVRTVLVDASTRIYSRHKVQRKLDALTVKLAGRTCTRKAERLGE